MSFIACRKEILEDGRTALGKCRALVMGGVNGLLAKKLPGIAKSGEGEWRFSARELIQLAGDAFADCDGILFDLTPGTREARQLLWLVDVNGRTMSLITDALFRFKVITHVKHPDSQGMIVVDGLVSGPDQYEQMRIEGGFAGGNWSWTEPPLAIGATVLHPAGH
jgi:hypothetical protein